MAPLKDLELEFSEIDCNFQQFCASHGILTVEDFLVHDLNVLVASAEQHPISKELKQGITRILSIIDNYHQPWLNGMKVLEDALQNKHVLSTGCEGIDLLLQGGLREGQLTELVGPSSSGKTQICLQAASNVADKNMGSVMFLDTCNSFSPRRIACFLTRKMSPSSKEDKQRSLERVMSNIFSYSVFDIFALLDVLQQLECKLRSQVYTGDNQMQLLIIDSISSLITPILGGNGANGRSLMISAGLLLKKLAHEHNLSVLVTNHMVGGEGGALKPALGESWKSVPHVRILLSPDRGGNLCDASLLKHPSVVCPSSFNYIFLSISLKEQWMVHPIAYATSIANCSAAHTKFLMAQPLDFLDIPSLLAFNFRLRPVDWYIPWGDLLNSERLQTSSNRNGNGKGLSQVPPSVVSTGSEGVSTCK